jgi:hypothetical protein
MQPTRFLVWRPIADAYIMYSAVYDENGNVVKFVAAEPPAGIPKLHSYERAYTHNVPVKVDDGHLRFFDLVERSCVQFSEQIPYGRGAHTFREVEVPVLEFGRHQLLPREFCSALVRI